MHIPFSRFLFRQSPLPIKWMAPESYPPSMRFTIETDIWSFGVLLYEIFSYGKTPYGDANSPVVMARVREGDRLPQPDACPDVVYALMRRCWNVSPTRRPPFGQICGELENFRTIRSSGEPPCGPEPDYAEVE